MRTDDEEVLSTLSEVYRVQPWLNRYDTQVDELLEICQSISEKRTILGLLERFKYIEAEDIESAFASILDYIVGDWNLDPKEIIICASNVEAFSDSSDAIAWFFKSKMAERNWGDVPVLNRFSKIPKFIAKRNHVVLVDEFIGTGRTSVKLVRYETNELRVSHGATDFTVRCCSVAGMHAGIKHVVNEGIECYSPFVLKKGISDYLAGDSLEQANSDMERLETVLLPDCNGKELPHFGDGRSEATYGMRLGNTPNSVFPIFWWKCMIDGSIRKTLLHRHENPDS